MPNYREDRPGADAPSHQHTVHERDRTGSDFITTLRGLINKARQEHTHSIRPLENASPAQIIHYELRRELWRHRHKRHNQQKADFYETLSDAWDALAVEKYTADITKEDAYDTLYFRHKHALERNTPNPDVISLSQQQTKIIDILADAANIPNRRKGCQYVPIPARGRRSNYWSDK
jgi:hypothetical protein